jgi:hypothetical protein
MLVTPLELMGEESAMLEDRKIIGEIRESRVRMSEECGHDPARYIANLKSLNHKYSAQIAMFREQRKSPAVDSDQSR